MDVNTLTKNITGNSIKNVYLFYGDENFLMASKLQALKTKWLAGGLEDLNYFIFDGRQPDAEKISDAVYGYPQMSERKLVVVRNPEIFSGTKSGMTGFLEDLIKNVPEYTCLVFEEKSVDARKKALLGLIEKKGGVVEFAPLAQNELAQWVEGLCDRQRKQMIRRDVIYFVSICDGSMAGIWNEFNKLLEFVGGRDKITREDIDAVVSKTIEIKIFELLDLLVSKKREEALRVISQLQKSKEQPTQALVLIEGWISELLMVKQLSNQSVPDADIKRFFEPNRQFLTKKHREQGRYFEEKRLLDLYRKGLEYDDSIKTGRIEGWTAVMMYAAEIMGEPA